MESMPAHSMAVHARECTVVSLTSAVVPILVKPKFVKALPAGVQTI
jgi:hypothetical protein